MSAKKGCMRDGGGSALPPVRYFLPSLWHLSVSEVVGRLVTTPCCAPWVGRDSIDGMCFVESPATRFS